LNENTLHNINNLFWNKTGWPITQFPCPFSVLAIALFIYYTSVLTGTEVK